MSILSTLYQVVLPIFGIVAVGWFFAAKRRVDERGLAAIVIQLSAPALVFHGLASRPIESESLLRVGGGVIFESLVCGAIALVVFRSLRITKRGLYLAAMFPNTGNLGLPLALLAFGEAGLTIAVVVFVAISLLHYTLGVMIVSNTRSPVHVMRSPLVLGALLGIAVAWTKVELPQPVLDFTKILGGAAVPLMLLGLGIRLRSVRVRSFGAPLLAVALRMAPGLLAGLLWCELFDMTGVERAIVLVTGVLPSAVMNFVLAEAHDQGGDDVAAAILIGTLLSIVTIPIVLSAAA